MATTNIISVMADPSTGMQIPTVGRVVTITLMMLTTIVLAFCITRRTTSINNWRRMQVPQWLVLAIYTDSLLFIITTAILTKSYNINEDVRICDGAILLCKSTFVSSSIKEASANEKSGILCYMSTKVLLYYFLVEKVFIIRNPWESRLKDKLYLFNVFGVILPYVILVILSFVQRIAYIGKDGKCVIGINKDILFPLTSFEIVLNIYLTFLFLAPLKKLYGGESTQNSQSESKIALKTMAMRTFIGSCCTLISTAVNLGVLAGLEGEKGWICLMLCNLDILFAVSVLHWATSLDKRISDTPTVATKEGTVMTEGERTTRQGSCVSNKGLRSMTGMQRKGSVALTWEDMELNSYDFAEDKLGEISEETTEVAPKDVKDVV
ncbi:hypothetical protein D6D00_07922 [Aureobasidium pullulans]|nr:hypothetical protein D6D00_07922 [Aureobasidium pullulans]